MRVKPSPLCSCLIWLLCTAITVPFVQSSNTGEKVIPHHQQALETHQSQQIESEDKPSSNRAVRRADERATDLKQPRIVGGYPAQPGQYPFYVKWNGCGAALIHSDIAISAAHCNVIMSTGVCVAGYTRNGCGEGGGVSRQVVARVQHPLYSTVTFRYDFLILKLDSPAPQKPIPLNSNPNNPVVGQLLTVIGVGVNATNGSVPEVLQQVQLPYSAPSVCSSVYGSRINNTIQFCAGGLPRGGKDSCQGDSGGPIFDSNGVLVGIVSTGEECALPMIPGIYGRISGVLDWINEQICALSASPPASCNSQAPSRRPAVSRTPRPTNIPTTVTVRVDITYDSRPSETAWSIRNSSGIVFYRSAFGAGGPNQAVTTYVKLIPGKYLFYIRDTGGDGICCRFGFGHFAVYVTANSRIRRVTRGNGKFKYAQARSFTVPPIL